MNNNIIQFLNPIDIEGIGQRYGYYPGPFIIDESDLQYIFPNIQTVQPEIISDTHFKGDANPPNLDLIIRIVRCIKPMVVLEVGTFRGKTAYNIAKNTSLESKIITIDLPFSQMETSTKYSTDDDYFQTKDRIGAFYQGTPEHSKIIQIYSDSTSQDCQNQIEMILKGNQIDFAFIDSAHDYLSTKRNFEELILPRLSPRGVVIFDNYGDLHTHVGVTHYLAEKSYNEGYVFYWYKPYSDPTSCVIFLNLPKSTGLFDKETLINK